MTVLVIRHVPHEGMGSLEKILREQNVPYEYLDVFTAGATHAPPLPSIDWNRYSGLVVLGGPMGVYEADRYPFLSKEIDLLKEGLRREIPILGICLGSQLLAAAAGARVFKGPRKEIGWFPIYLKAEAQSDPLLKHCSTETMAFHWHGDTFDLPEKAILLASSERFAHQAFRIGDTAWGLQFHLEITEPMIRDWVKIAEEKSKNPSPDWNACEVLTQTPCYLPDLEPLARKVFGEFADLVRGRAPH